MKSAFLLSFTLIAFSTLAFKSVAIAAGNANSDSLKAQGISNSDSGSQMHAGRDGLSGLDGEKSIFPEVGQSLPILDIQSGGELSVSNSTIVRKPWSSKTFETAGKVQLVQYVAANLGVGRQNKRFNDTLAKKQFSSEMLSTTVILNMVDTASFARGMVAKKVAKKKVQHQTINFVIDDDGMGLQHWGMKHYSYAIIILDANGKVLFAKDGPLTEDEVESTILLIESQLS